MGLSLVKLAEYKSYTGKNSTTDDAAITTIIPKVSELVKSICRRSFVDYVNDSKVEQFNNAPHGILNLTEPNVLTLDSVEFSTDYGLTYTNLEEYLDYVLDKKADQVTLLNHAEYNRINAFQVSYTAGYETLPEDLKIAVLDLVTYYLRNEASINSQKGVGSNNVQIEYVTNSKLPAHIQRILDLYAANYL